jgi:very-short-patch-repair endonuclease
VVTHEDLARLGATDRQRKRLLRVGVLVPYIRRVHRFAAAPRTWEQAAALAGAVSPDVVVSHRSAGRMWRLRRLGSELEPGQVEVLFTGRAHRLLPGTVPHRCHVIDPAAAAILSRALRQHTIVMPAGERVRVDFYSKPEAEVLEIDHVTWHGGKVDLTEDKRRDPLVRRLGLHTTRVTDTDVRQRLDAVIDDLRVILTRTHGRSVS